VGNGPPLDREDVVTMMATLFDIRADVRRVIQLLEETMKRKRKKMTPEERAAWEARYEETQGKLQERIAYHTAKLEEERRAAAGGA
jgi:predicted nuclease with TOPRIM domain